jgi:hypothetical protein
MTIKWALFSKATNVQLPGLYDSKVLAIAAAERGIEATEKMLSGSTWVRALFIKDVTIEQVPTKETKITDVELQALAALVSAQVFERAAENKLRELHGHPPIVGWEALDKLEAELTRRGVLIG